MNSPKPSPNRIALWAVVGMLLALLLGGPRAPQETAGSIEYSQFLSQVQQGQIREVKIQDRNITGTRSDGSRFTTYSPGDPALVGDLLKRNVAISAEPPAEPSLLGRALISWAPFLLLIGVWLYFMRRSLGGGGGVLSVGKSRARRAPEGGTKVTLADVAGVQEAKEDVAELVDFLRSPERFRALGGRIPRGVLMFGPPGTGKTLLARAIAGEAGVPFFTVSGSDFVEMFVGVGASRVRDLFEQAKQHAPCIVFIDEIDAVGRHRGAGLGGGHDEREQTLNQLLVEMDGFAGNEGVIVIAATNRPDVLDPALLRPGRFDRQVAVPLPDVAGREQILKLHLRKVPLAEDVEPAVIARGTPGFSGADLANLVNEAALMAARGGHSVVGMVELERAKDKLLMGAERRSMVMTPEQKRLTAYHEAGHAVVGRLVPEHDPVHKVSIIPRGRALGVTLFLPEQDRYSHSKQRLESQIATLFGGRLAEELVLGADAVTTGAQNDIQRATEIARNMVTKWGLSDKLGPLAYGEEQGEVFLGHAVTQRRETSDQTARLIDAEVRAIVERNYLGARTLLVENMDKLHAMAEALIRYETLSAAEIDRIMAGLPVERPDDDPGAAGGAAPTTRADRPESGRRGVARPVVGVPVAQQ